MILKSLVTDLLPLTDLSWTTDQNVNNSISISTNYIQTLFELLNKFSLVNSICSNFTDQVFVLPPNST